MVIIGITGDIIAICGGVLGTIIITMAIIPVGLMALTLVIILALE
jgi:hypothetical protein